MREVYIDGDVLPYKIGFATQRRIYRLDMTGLHSSPVVTTCNKVRINQYVAANEGMTMTENLYSEEPMQVINTLRSTIANIVRGSGCKIFKVVLSGEDNFRDNIATIQPYKGNRVGTIKPVHFNLIREWLLDKEYTIVSVNEEADDVISRAMMQGHVGASPDKDLNNTPGSHYNFNSKKRYEVSEAEARYNFYTQMLVGDTADHIPGIKGVGPKTAAKLLAGCRYEWEYEVVIFREYKKVYDDPYDALTEVGQLLWMSREEGDLWQQTGIPASACSKFDLEEEARYEDRCDHG